MYVNRKGKQTGMGKMGKMGTHLGPSLLSTFIGNFSIEKQHFNYS